MIVFIFLVPFHPKVPFLFILYFLSLYYFSSGLSIPIGAAGGQVESDKIAEETGRRIEGAKAGLGSFFFFFDAGKAFEMIPHNLWKEGAELSQKKGWTRPSTKK